MPKIKVTPDQIRFAIVALKARCVAPRANMNLISWHHDAAGAKIQLDWIGKQLQQLAETYEPALRAGKTLVAIAMGDRSVLEPPDRVERALLERAIDELEDQLKPSFSPPARRVPLSTSVH